MNTTSAMSFIQIPAHVRHTLPSVRRNTCRSHAPGLITWELLKETFFVCVKYVRKTMPIAISERGTKRINRQ